MVATADGNGSAEGPIEVLQGKLWFFPEGDRLPDGFEGELVNAIDLCKEYAASGRKSAKEAGKYIVTHYGEKAIGKAFGPLGLSSVLWFARSINLLLESDNKVVVSTPPGNQQMRTNAAALLGGYLILELAWTTELVMEVLGKPESLRTFICSWTREDKGPRDQIMTVKDCWDGYQLALTYGFIDPACLRSDDATEWLCNQWQSTVYMYDASWIVPGIVMVCADPVTTRLDPNPATFKELYPSTLDAPDTFVSVNSIGSQKETGVVSKESKESKEAANVLSNPSRVSVASGMSNGIPKLLSKGEFDNMSADTCCKEYRNWRANSRISFGNLDKAGDFVSFLRDAGVGTVVRTNLSREPGMPKEGSYDAADFRMFGLHHHDIPIIDLNGGLPKREDVKKMLTSCPQLDSWDGAVAVHCKGGFGRSVMLACCLAIDRINIPGDALLGWVRTVRPGSVNTPQQERFLKSLKGRADVRAFARMSSSSIMGEGSQPGCGCTVQ